MQNNQTNSWEQELRKMFQNSAILEDFRIVGRTVMDNYLEMFQAPSQSQNMTQSM